MRRTGFSLNGLKFQKFRARETPIPVYYKLQMEIKRGIEKGQWAPGDVIPPDRKIAEDYGVSLGTVNKAIMNLVSEGYLFRIQGKGTFVSGTDIPVEKYRYTFLRESFNSREAQFRIKISDLRIVKGRQPVNRHLKLRITQDLISLERLLVSRQKPLVYNLSYLPHKMFKNFEKLPLPHLEKVSLYETIEKEYGFPTISNQEMFSAEAADKTVAEALEIEGGSPVLKVEMISFTYGEKPYEYRVSYYSQNRYRLFRQM